MLQDNSQPNFEKTGIIYMVHLSSGKKYIGQHSNNDINERKKTHYHQYIHFCKKKKTLKNSSNPDDKKLRNPKGFCTALYNAFKKHSYEKCVWVVLENNIPLNKLNDIEDNYIIELNTMQPKGYNLKINNKSEECKSFADDELKGMPKHVNFIKKVNPVDIGSKIIQIVDLHNF
jgi:hypothetical protein